LGIAFFPALVYNIDYVNEDEDGTKPSVPMLKRGL